VTDSSGAGFGIQTAARQTGISVHTLRAWEQRHKAIDIARSPAGRRRYSPADLERLRLLKRLVDCGERIGRIAGLSDAQLRTRCSELGLEARQADGRRLRIAAWGDTLPVRLSALSAQTRLVATSSSLEDFLAQCQRAAPQVIMIEVDNLTARKLALLRRLRSSLPDLPLGIIYGFARRRDIELLRAACDSLSRAPADLQAMLDQLARLSGPADADRHASPAVSPEKNDRDTPARRFTARQLAFLATQGTAIDCECPAHLVQLVQTLLAFERYSAGCAQDDPAEAALHRMLLETTAQSRRRLEDALSEVAAHEGIEIPD
jgi:DNA-binding transcriptional MerR regulator